MIHLKSLMSGIPLLIISEIVALNPDPEVPSPWPNTVHTSSPVSLSPVSLIHVVLLATSAATTSRHHSSPAQWTTVTTLRVRLESCRGWSTARRMCSTCAPPAECPTWSGQTRD